MKETREKETREKETREREREKREKTGIKSVHLEDCFRLHWNQQHYIWRRPTCKEPAVVSKMKTAACQNRWEHVFSADAPAEPNMGMERGTTIIPVSTDSALIRWYKFRSLKKCKLNFTYKGKFPWEKRVQIYCESLMVIALKPIKLWNGKRHSHGSGICRFSINQRREMHSIWKFRQILDICRLVWLWMRKRS